MCFRLFSPCLSAEATLDCRITLHSGPLLPQLLTMPPTEGWLPLCYRLSGEVMTYFPSLYFSTIRLPTHSAAYWLKSTLLLPLYSLPGIAWMSFPHLISFSWAVFPKDHVKQSNVFYLTFSKLALSKVLWLGFFCWCISPFTFYPQKFPFPFDYCWAFLRQCNSSQNLPR